MEHVNRFRNTADREGLPFEATRGGKETTYPEYQLKLKELMAKPSKKTVR